MLVKLRKVRLSYPNLFTATSFQGEGDKSYSASFIFPKNHPDVKEVEAALLAAAKEKWGDKGAATLKELKGKDRVCLHDGDNKSESDGYAGNFYISARRREKDRAPTVLDGDKTPLTVKDGKPYGGCIVNGHIEIYAQDNAFGKRINATLLGVQFAGHGEPFSGSAPAATDAFEVEETDDSDLDGLV